jgi:hypothetical protein
MSANSVKPLRTLVGVRKRQQERLEAALAEQRRLLAVRQAEAAQALDEARTCAERECSCRTERETLLASGFMPHQLITLQHHQDTLAAATAEANKLLKKREAAVTQQTQAVDVAQRETRRNAQRIDGFKAQIAKLLSAREQAQEDSAEEEAEETSTARFCGRQRAALENQDGV